MGDVQLRRHVTSLSRRLFRDRPQLLSKVDEERLIDELIDESFGLGPLEPYMRDPEVADILVNGPHEVYVERQGCLYETDTVFADEEHLMQIIQRVVSRVGRRIDSQSPMVDARLADGSRINAVIPPLALNGPTLSIRRFGRNPLDIERGAGPRFDLPGDGGGAPGGHRGADQRHDQRRHRFRQDDDAQRPLAFHSGRRAVGDDRGLGRTAASPQARRANGNPHSHG